MTLIRPCILIELSLLVSFTLMIRVQCGKTQRYRELRYHTQITNTPHELKWDFTEKMFFFELTVRSHDPVVGMGFSDHGDTDNADFMVTWLDSQGQRHVQDTWTDSYSIMHADVHQSYTVDGVKAIQTDNTDDEADGMIIRFSRERKSCDLQDYHIDTGTTNILMFTAPYIMAAPAMVNTSQFNLTLTRVQILKSQLPAGKIPPDTQTIDITNKQVRIPSVETTYWCSIHRMPMMRIKKHIIKYEGLISSASKKIVHHMEVYSCEISPKVHVPMYNGPCDSKPRTLSGCSKVIGAWAMGADSFSYPEEAGIPIGDTVSSGYVMLEIHFNNPTLLSDVIDSSGVRFSVTSQLRPYDAAIMEVGVTYDSRGSIPPRQDKFFLEGVCSEKCSDRGLPEDGITVFASQLHTHLAGRRVRTMHIRDGLQLPDLNGDKHYNPMFQEIRLLQQPVKVLPGDALITECEYSTWHRENITLGGFSIQQEMCVNYLHYYPKTSLEVCKGTISNSALQRFFTMMAYYMRAKTSAYQSVSENFDSMKWNSVNSRLLQWFYDTMPIDAECKHSDGTYIQGRWSHITKPRVWLSDRYNPIEEHDCDEQEKERFYKLFRQ